MGEIVVFQRKESGADMAARDAMFEVDTTGTCLGLEVHCSPIAAIFGRLYLEKGHVVPADFQ